MASCSVKRDTGNTYIGPGKWQEIFPLPEDLGQKEKTKSPWKMNTMNYEQMRPDFACLGGIQELLNQ